MKKEAILALDIGGANVKIAHSSGAARSAPFALWKHPEGLAPVLHKNGANFPRFDRLLVTMTAELCDCFATKREGVAAVLDSVAAAWPGVPIAAWGTDGRFHDRPGVDASPGLVAASNWRALAEVAASLVGDRPGLLIDVGSTTTDIIGLQNGVANVGRTDTERLGTGELSYIGVRRTPVCAIAREAPFRGKATRLMAELFATTLDVYLTLGSVTESPEDRDTADGRPATRENARGRLARMVGEDWDGFGHEDAALLSSALDGALMLSLVESGRSVVGRLGWPPEVVVTSGSGEFLARRLAIRLAPPGCALISIGDSWGPEASSAACAVSLLKLWESRYGDG